MPEPEPQSASRRAAKDRDPAVADALAAGDPRRVLGALMRGHGDEIYRFCFSMLADRALADDVHQAVFVAAFESLATLDDPSKARAWLYGIARHRCLDAVKARRRFNLRFILSADAGAEDAAAPPEAHETSETSPALTALQDCVRGLAPHVRVAVLLRYEQNLPYEEIARMSRERAGTLQTRVARGLLALRDCVSKKVGEVDWR